MQSFRTEIENPIVERDIVELEKKIKLFKDGKLDEEKFRSLRLARGVYGQRQQGVQMIRIKLPYGKVTSQQLEKIADVSDEYSNGNLHITTRQDIQIHYVSLDRTPELWAELEKDDVTLREACGNTVRNITASETAGIDTNEPFDVTPFAHTLFQYFLRNPVSQELGRKFKISFSASEEDTALAYLHDLGFIPILRKGKKGFKVLLGGGLGSQPRHGDVIFDFLETEKLVPYTEAVIRTFDRFGERARRQKARLKFLIKDIGLETFLNHVEKEKNALKFNIYPIDDDAEQINLPEYDSKYESDEPNTPEYRFWKSTNVIRQKQDGLVAIGLKVQLGNFSSTTARKIAALIKNLAGNELRFSLRQNILIRHIREELVPYFYEELKKLNLVAPGFNSTIDITACPGTDTCNLGIANSTAVAVELEKTIALEYVDLITNKDILIKISGCMNSCGQHMMAHIGFQGMSLNADGKVAPALQILLGGGTLGDGNGRFADKIIKIPSKRGVQALKFILNDYQKNAGQTENFLEYYDRQQKVYFYDLLKELGKTENLESEDFVDWGHDNLYEKAIGTGECAGVVIDLVATLLLESEEKLDLAHETLNSGQWADSIYHSYTALLNTAKALVTSKGIQVSSHITLIRKFDEIFVETGEVNIDGFGSFAELVLQINEKKPEKAFAGDYFNQSQWFLKTVYNVRNKVVSHEN